MAEASATCAMVHGMTAVFRPAQPLNMPSTVVAASPTPVRSTDSSPVYQNAFSQFVTRSAFSTPLNDTLPSFVSLAKTACMLVRSAISRFARSTDSNWLYSGSVVPADLNAFSSVDDVLTPGSNDTDLM